MSGVRWIETGWLTWELRNEVGRVLAWIGGRHGDGWAWRAAHLGGGRSRGGVEISRGLAVAQIQSHFGGDK